MRVWTDQHANRCVLRLRGGLCAETVPILDRHVDLLGCRSLEEVVLDLTGLEAIDPVGARLIVGLGHYVVGRGGRFSVQGSSASADALIASAEVELAD